MAQNVISNPVKYLTTGGDDPFLPSLITAISQATEIEFAVSFIRMTGLRLIFKALSEALTAESPVPIRIVTTDYLCITEPLALKHLMILKGHGADIRLFNAGKQSFHMKSYIFIKGKNNGLVSGEAFIGSSNITNAALTNGLEWNYRVTNTAENSAALSEIHNEFEILFNHSKVINLEHNWISQYELRYRRAAKSNLPGATEVEPAPKPTSVQTEALTKLAETRDNRYKRALVVMATGLGKTWLAAFDAQQTNAKRILFVAHREEILIQAEQTFLRIRPDARTGQFNGKNKNLDVDVLCASVQTLSRLSNLSRFSQEHFDYIVVDEFHHAAASTYRALLGHFKPEFLLGLTATPDRTDQSDILSLCDDNLVFDYNLTQGINSKHLAPFHYHGIFDEGVNYQEIPWRNNKFDPKHLANHLATLGRAKNIFKQWKEKAQKRTLAFCISRSHAQFMADQFNSWDIKSEAIYGGSKVKRSEGLLLLESGLLQVVFCVDLFNEGVDLPSIDTVMMLRPTESKVMFLQQLGRGLRKSKEKSHLVVMDFIGNHQGFFNKHQALFNVGPTHNDLIDFGKRIEKKTVDIPDDCFVNYDLEIINFLKQLDENGLTKEYELLKATSGRRPTLTEMYRTGIITNKLKEKYGSWWQLVSERNDLTETEQDCLNAHQDFFKEVEITSMTKIFKMVVLESLIEHDGFLTPPTNEALALQAFSVFSRRRTLIADIKQDLQDLENVSESKWNTYWRGNPINAWTGGNKKGNKTDFFFISDNKFHYINEVSDLQTFSNMLQELIDYRYAKYEPRLKQIIKADNVLDITSKLEMTSLPYYPDIKIACGHFKAGSADDEQTISIALGYGKLDPNRHFIAQAKGSSMDGGKSPIKDNDFLLLEWIGATNSGSNTGTTMAIERIDQAGSGEYLLRDIQKDSQGKYVLHARNPEYGDIEADAELNTFARLKGVINLKDLEFES